ncbi:MAG: phosphotransferase family protein [Gemmatimonadetes bacterium]|nr:phosphotransferase family protein [Gemmatimonadota bacterium]
MTTPPLDSARPVRKGEEIDAAKLSAWCATHAPEVAGEITVQQFPRGFSNLTYLLSVGGRDYVLRRPPRGVKKGSAHDMSREFRILTALHARGGPVPRPVANCEDESVIGAPFYIMERVAGVILRSVPPAGVTLDAATMRGLSHAFVEALIGIHATPLDTPGIAELGHPEGYVTRQVQGWAARYERARTDDVPDMAWLARWLDEHRPAESGGALIHNDFKYDNFVLDPADLTRIIAVLDWEMTTVGDPLMDLGTSLGYWVDGDDPPELRALGLGITALPGNLSRNELWARYHARTGRALTDPVFYYVFGLFKLAVIAQQIYARFQAGLTTDERFASLGLAVRALAALGRRAVELRRIDRLG